MFKEVDSSPEAYTNRSMSIELGAGQSFSRGVKASFIAIPAAAEAVVSALSDEPSEGWALRTMKAYQIEKDNGNISGGAFLAGEVVGTLINPLTYVGPGAVGGRLAAKGLGAAFKIGETAGGKFAKNAVEFGLQSATSMVPQHIVENYNTDTNRIDTLGVSKAMGIDAALGVAFAGIPFAYGLIRGKVTKISKKSSAQEEISPDSPANSNFTEKDIQSAFENNHINESEFNVLNSVLKKESVPASDLIRVFKENNIPYDPGTGHVNVSLLKNGNLKALYNSVADSISSKMGAEDINTLNHYIANEDILKIITDEKMIKGLKGVATHFDERILKKEAHLSKIDKRIIEPYLTKGLTKEASLTQEKLYQAIKNGESTGSAHIPENVKKFIMEEEEIKDLYKRRALVNRAIDKSSEGETFELSEKLSSIENRIEELSTTRAALLHPKEEMEHLFKSLTGKKFEGKIHLDSNFARLLDLTAHWENAKLLHRRVMREESYESQEAFSSIAKSLVMLSENPNLLKTNTDNIVKLLEGKINVNKIEAKEPPIENINPRGTKVEKSFEDIEKQTSNKETIDLISSVKAKSAALSDEPRMKKFLDCIFGVV